MKPLNVGDLVKVKSGFTKDKIAIVIEDVDKTDGETYKLHFDGPWVGWQKRKNLLIIKRAKKKI